MISTSLPNDLAGLKIGDSGSIRAVGLHASDVYSRFYQDFDPKRYKKDGNLPLTLLEIGLAFEVFLEQWLARKVELAGQGQISRPGEFTYETIFADQPVTVHYNPDLLIYNGITRLGEIKATKMASGVPNEWLSEEEFPKHAEEISQIPYDPKYAKYLSQIKMYLRMLGMLHARLYVFYINGRKWDLVPQLLVWDLEFTQDELDMEWNMLMNHALSCGILSPKEIECL